ncbi:hypothetical protein KUTeg_001262 [Tegillarca granosa]|uniref:Uncharacterized protein n=1 Tax=Tegillarca granosa TaxID=220873 RepID=A0ABQ9FWH3_TEGGR|nr:hypothetical protein KUTeg_001262 [Tegillarca granosa]
MYSYKKMEDFLEERGIDEQVVAELNAEDLGKYLKRYGDCIAAITFAKQLKVLEEKPSKKMSLREKLFQKLKTKDQNDEHKKLLRLYLVSVTKTKQVTAMNTDNKSSVAEISMCEGLATGGKPVLEINCPQNSLLPSPRSEGLEICPINIPVDIGGSSESRKRDECPINIPINIGNSVTLSKGVLDIPLSVFLDTTQSACLDQLQACDDMELKSIHSFSSQDELSLVNHDSASLQTLNEHENMYSVADESYAENPTDFINECGQDADGVSRDANSAFWESFFLRNADGETYRVPVLSKDYG